MYVARRAFRNYGKMITPGSIIEPGAVKWFKTRLKDRQIIEVTSQSFKEWKEYFADKYDVELKYPKPTEQAEKVVEPPKVTIKPVVKVQSK